MKIEPGCLAMIHGAANPENNGKVVDVLERRGGGEQWLGNRVWYPDEGDCLWHISSRSKDIVVQNTISGETELVRDRLMSEKCLLRIDGGQFERETEQEKELVQ